MKGNLEVSIGYIKLLEQFTKESIGFLTQLGEQDFNSFCCFFFFFFFKLVIFSRSQVNKINSSYQYSFSNYKNISISINIYIVFSNFPDIDVETFAMTIQCPNVYEESSIISLVIRFKYPNVQRELGTWMWLHLATNTKQVYGKSGN